MTGDEMAVVAAGAALIGGINWYFFGGRGAAVAAGAAADGSQEVEIVVRGGYTPGAITLEAGRPVRLRFNRQETSGCSEEVVFPELGIRKFLPPFETTVVGFTPTSGGTFSFTCGMGMLRGSMVITGQEG